MKHHIKPNISGIIIGFLLKDKIKELVGGIIYHTLNTFHKIKNNGVENTLQEEGKIKDIFFISKITNQEVFNENFKNNVKNNVTLQPVWDFYERKNVIKIPLDQDFIKFLNTINDYEVSFQDFINIKNKDEYYVTLDIPFFESFSDVYLYINYTIDDRNYTNVYNKNYNICSNDFKMNKNSFKTFYNNIICSSFEYKKNNKVKIEYATNYAKMFTNNPDKVKITPEILIINYDKINVSLNEVKFKTITLNSENKEYLINDYFIQNEEQFKE
jgi:hypothetical protein